jgi:glycosyltransferase involved in cell wall biosynthesis
MKVYVDLTGLRHGCPRAGVRRVCRALLATPVDGAEIVPCALQGDRLVRIRGRVRLLERPFGSGAAGAAAPRWARWVPARRIAPQAEDRILVPDPFTDPARVDHWEEALRRDGGRIGFLFYDLIPWSTPEHQRLRAVESTYPYLRLLRTAAERGRVAFLSRDVRDRFRTRLLRSGELRAPVLRPGSEALGSEAPTAAARAPWFSMVAALEPWKNHAAVLDAFEAIWPSHPDVRLDVVGEAGPDAGVLESRLRDVAARVPSFAWHGGLDDAAARAVVRASRATIFVSAAEGFGLPPVESLRLGVPVIATEGIPSLEDYGSTGIERVAAPTAAAIRAAVDTFRDDEHHARKVAEIGRLDLPAWSGFVRELVAWLRA